MNIKCIGTEKTATTQKTPYKLLSILKVLTVCTHRPSMPPCCNQPLTYRINGGQSGQGGVQWRSGLLPLTREVVPIIKAHQVAGRCSTHTPPVVVRRYLNIGLSLYFSIIQKALQTCRYMKVIGTRLTSLHYLSI